MILAGGSAGAHHSYARFLTDQTVSIEGDVESVSYVNPHVILRVRARDSFTYTAEWRSANQLARSGMTSSTLKVGDHVIVSGSPGRDATDHVMSLLKEVRRPADGWSWSR